MKIISFCVKIINISDPSVINFRILLPILSDTQISIEQQYL